jgi:hypothetical protein
VTSPAVIEPSYMLVLIDYAATFRVLGSTTRALSRSLMVLARSYGYTRVHTRRSVRFSVVLSTYLWADGFSEQSFHPPNQAFHGYGRHGGHPGSGSGHQLELQRRRCYVRAKPCGRVYPHRELA